MGGGPPIWGMGGGGPPGPPEGGGIGGPPIGGPPCGFRSALGAGIAKKAVAEGSPLDIRLIRIVL